MFKETFTIFNLLSDGNSEETAMKALIYPCGCGGETQVLQVIHSNETFYVIQCLDCKGAIAGRSSLRALVDYYNQQCEVCAMSDDEYLSIFAIQTIQAHINDQRIKLPFQFLFPFLSDSGEANEI